MRLISVLLLLVGAGLAFAYPAILRAGPVQPIGTYNLFGPQSGFLPVTVPLRSAQAPLGVEVDIVATVRVNGQPKGTLITMTVAGDGRTVLVGYGSIENATVRAETPQSAQKVFTIDIGRINSIDDGEYVFTPGPGDLEGIEIQSAILRVASLGRANADERVQPIGLAVMAIGFIGAVVGFRRRRVPAAGPVERTALRWGRGGDR